MFEEAVKPTSSILRKIERPLPEQLLDDNFTTHAQMSHPLIQTSHPSRRIVNHTITFCL
jgi:hypothetical protein